MASNPQAPEDLIAAMLRGEAVDCSALGEEASDALLAAASRHGVVPLLYHSLQAWGRLGACPPGLARDLARAAQREAALERLRAKDLRATLAVLAARGVAPLLLKGAALAYTHYPQPGLRPRRDTDLLIAETDLARARAALDAAGYARPPAVEGSLVSYQRTWVHTDPLRVPHAYDLHWRLSNRPLIADAGQSFEELAARSVALPALGPQARALSPPDALLLACVHRVAHHYDDDSLIWLNDIWLLARDLADPQIDLFRELAQGMGVSALCRHSLRMALERLGTAPLPPPLSEWLNCPDAETPDASTRLLEETRRVDVLRSDLAALGSWRERWRLLREHLFPPAEYMRARFGVRSPLLLPALYLLRAARGLFRLVRRIER